MYVMVLCIPLWAPSTERMLEVAEALNVCAENQSLVADGQNSTSFKKSTLLRVFKYQATYLSPDFLFPDVTTFDNGFFVPLLNQW